MRPREPKPTILLVEDYADVRTALELALEDEGYRAVSAGSGEEALAYLRSNPAPALILLDWNMSPMNGAQLMDALAAERTGLAIPPIILMTADLHVEEKARKHNCVAFLKKPADLETLLDLLARHVPG